MAMTPGLRKFALSAHLTVSIGWIGTVIAYLAFSVAAMTTDDADTLRSAWIAMDLIGWYVIVPLAIASLITGLVMSLGTKWGLFRHYWVVISLVLTTLATVVLLLHMPSVSELAARARATEGMGPEMNEHLVARLREGDWLHPALGLLVLLVVQALNLYKPSGLTRYGWRKQQPGRMDERLSTPA
jgi:uncharacterized membrane protein